MTQPKDQPSVDDLWQKCIDAATEVAGGDKAKAIEYLRETTRDSQGKTYVAKDGTISKEEQT